jgi:hypothetical protein
MLWVLGRRSLLLFRLLRQTLQRNTLLLRVVQAEGRMLAVAVAQADTEPMFLVQHLAVEVRQKPFLALLQQHTQLLLVVVVLVVLLTPGEQLVKTQYFLQ